MTNPTDLRIQAKAHHAAAEESFDATGHDGFATQIAHRLTGEQKNLAATLAEENNLATFTGLYDVATGRRILAKIVASPFGDQWQLHASESALIAARGKRWLPMGDTSRVLRSLGLVQSPELAAAEAKIVSRGNATGFSGLTACHTQPVRTGDEYGAGSLRLYGCAHD